MAETESIVRHYGLTTKLRNVDKPLIRGKAGLDETVSIQLTNIFLVVLYLGL